MTVQQRAGAAPAPGEAPAVPADVLLARAYLSRVAEPPAPGLVALVAEVGPVEAAERVRKGAVRKAVADETRARRRADRAAADLRAATRVGARVLVPEDDDWPSWPFTAFDVAADDQLSAPVALWVRGGGRLAGLVERAVAVVGARAATGYGQFVAHDMAFSLGTAGFTVISGAAFGIDAAAHRGALAAEAPGIAVLACGVDRFYPAEHADLLRRIADTGLVVSEYPPGAIPARHRFLVRNRLIAALGAGTVVVEAGLRSGARRTARDTAGLGRPVMAVPGPVTSALSAGCHELVRDHAAVVVSRVEDVIETVGRIGIDLAVPRAEPPPRPTDGLSTEVLRVHDALPARAPRSTYRLSVESGVPLDAVRAALPELERRGLAEHADGSWRRAQAGRR